MTQTPSIEVSQEKEMTVIIRPELKRMCNKDVCRAALFNHILYWIARKHMKYGEPYWYATGEQLYKQSCETWGITKIRHETNELIKNNFIGTTRNPAWGSDRTKYFYFEEEQARAFFEACAKEDICPLCISFSDEVEILITTHLIILSNANDKSVKCICQKCQLHLTKLSNPFDKSVTAITKETTKGTNKEVSNSIPEESNGEHTDTLASPHVGALSLSQSIDTESHSHQDSPIADSNTTPSEGDTDHAPVPAPGHPHRLGDAPGAGGDSHDTPLDDRQVAAPEPGPDVEAGQEEIDALGHAWQSVDDEQTASHEDVPVVAASPLDTSTVEPGESEKGTLPAAPVTPAQGADDEARGIGDVKPGRGKRARHAKKVDLDDVTQGRVNKVIAYLDKLKQEVMEDPAIKYRPTQTDTDAIVDVLLPQSPSEKRVRKVFFDMWNEKSRDGTYFWRKRMKIHNICNEYESRIMGLEGKDKEDSQEPKPDKDKTVGGYQFFQFDEVESTLSVMQA